MILSLPLESKNRKELVTLKESEATSIIKLPLLIGLTLMA